MSNFLKATLAIVVSVVLAAAALCAYELALHAASPSFTLPLVPVAIAGAIVGLLYGLEAGLLLSYDLSSVSGWLTLIIDLTWSLPSTIFGLVVGNIAYPFLGSLSRTQSEGQRWISYSRPQAHVPQTLGTVNLGGPGAHEPIHLLQARILGPAFLPFGLAAYIVTGLLQILWTITIGGILYLAGKREKPYFSPPETSAVPGFFGWIYFATPYELWAYATQ